MQLPSMIKARQKFNNPRVSDIPTTVEAELDKLLLQKKIKPGARIAVTAGSRGIASIPLILKCCLDKLLQLGAKPFIVTAMGSHGGATAEGQLSVLERLGITESSMGAPILSSMEVVQVGTLPSGHPVYMDRYAWESDGVLAVNRIKTHTSMLGEVESGLMKMISVGLGNEKGCSSIHQRGLDKTIPGTARVVLTTNKILGGLAIIENSAEEIAELQAVEANKMEDSEKDLLATAKELIPRLPFEKLDVLIVEEIGKNISGTGMDTKVIGRLMLPHLPEPSTPRVNIIVALDLSEKTGGNSLGIGLADITTRKLVQKIDFQAMYKNAMATGFLNRASIPITIDNDREAILLALRANACSEAEKARIVRIRNTLELRELYFSEALSEEAHSNTILEILSDPQPMVFDEQGNLI